jgi:fatty-acyl-CoA synthase
MTQGGVGDWIRRRRVRSAGHAALIFRDEPIAYDTLADRVDRLAAALQDRGIAPGDRVAFLGNNHPSFIEAMFATLRVGGVFVPLNTRLTVPEIAYMLGDSSPRLVFATSPLEPLAAAASAELEHPLARVVIDEDLDAPVDLSADAERFEAVLASASSAEPVAVPVASDDPALIVYTSGTTGKPKGAVLSHGNLTWNALNVLVDYDLVSTDRALMISPLFHVASLGMGCLPSLLKGATVLLEERFVPGDALHAIEKYGATVLSGVPTTFQLMMEDPAWSSTDISSLRLLTCGGSAVPARVREAYEQRGLAFSGGYGMTEASPGITMLPPRFSEERAGSGGLAHFFSEFRITGATDELGSGEIEARGPNVFSGYWGLEGASREAFTEDGWLRTGDVGRVDDQGFLFIEDRLKDMIISGGENIYSAEVELAIAAIDGVTGVAVIGVPHERWGEVPHAVVTLAADCTLDPEDMVAQLSTRLARYKVPRTLEVVDELPRTASGKVRKQVLRERYSAQAE